MESVYGINTVEIDAEAQPTYDSFLHFLLLSQPSKDMAPVRPLCVRHPACETGGGAAIAPVGAYQ